MDFDRHTRRARQVDLTPLIDVVFLLVVFFMLSTSFVLSEAIELSLPSLDGNEAPAPQSSIRMLVQEDGQVVAGKHRYDVNALDRVVRELLRRNPDQAFTLLAAPDVGVQHMVTAMDILYVNGAKAVQMDHVYEGTTPNIGGDVKIRNGASQ